MISVAPSVTYVPAGKRPSLVGLYIRCPLCGKLSHQANFERAHAFPDAKVQWSRGGRRKGSFLWTQAIGDKLLEVKAYLRMKVEQLARGLGIEWQESRSASIQVVPSSYGLTTVEPSFNQRIPVTSSQFLRITKSSSLR